MKRTSTYEAVDTASLMPLSQMNDFKVAGDNPDVRGWDVFASDDKKIGRVDDLLVDRNGTDVRYLVVDLDRGLLASLSGRSGHVLVPVGEVRLDRNSKVYLDSLASSEANSLQSYDLESFRGSAGSYQGGMESRTNERRAEGMGNEREARVTVSEEELAVGKRTVSAGEVGVQKRVETEHVRQSVPVMREEVTIERRPITGTSTATEIGEDEIRVPLTQEEVVVQKRVVPKEELVIKKHQVQDQQVVEEDVRRERAEVVNTGDVKNLGETNETKRR
jgi:uncharacterized protein (TIGR02271 family)